MQTYSLDFLLSAVLRVSAEMVIQGSPIKKIYLDLGGGSFIFFFDVQRPSLVTYKQKLYFQNAKQNDACWNSPLNLRIW